jgi:hypothetical protein
MNGGQFRPGQPRPVGSGRQKGTPNKQTELIRAGVKTAIETCREGGMTPVEIMVESARFLRSLAEMKMPRKQEQLAAMPRADLDWIVDLLVKASDIAHKAAPFGFPRLAAIDHVGDAPKVGVRTVFTLHIPPPAAAPWLRSEEQRGEPPSEELP